MDDWQETHLTTRHIHNRTGTRNNQRGSKAGSNSTSTFDVARTFGTYDVKCPAADRLSGLGSGPGSGTTKSKSKGKGGSKVQAPSMSTLEIYTLNGERNAVVGEIVLGGGAVTGTVILAGSRKVLEGAVRGFEKEGKGEGEGDEVSLNGKVDEHESQSQEENEKDGIGGGIVEENVDDEEENEDEKSNDDDDDNDDEEDEDESDTTTNQRVREFEKNSFRSPKFWIRWQGQVPAPDSTTTDEKGTSVSNGDESHVKLQTVTDAGYIVFSGNQCDRFQGTISCEALGWKNVKMSGWKVKSQSARDFQVNWVAT